ncbi:hypothetical protein [Mangrovicoccus sp. HB161399]|uniref:hypothetical protein n=1 Tax=Mangrovicoccus sp. HB161399 TaxID=2720392 RepID=UPI001554403A|nr:hypothetical protein [Mangrovicoccus sp. HB161399]
MTIAFDGTNYRSATSGSAAGTRLAKCDAPGNDVGAYAPGLDFRSVFTDDGGRIHARTRSSATVCQQTADGAFSPYLTLSGGTLGDQSAVVRNNAGVFVAIEGGTVERRSATGAYLGSVALSGHSGSYPHDRGKRGSGRPPASL